VVEDHQHSLVEAVVRVQTKVETQHSSSLWSLHRAHLVGGSARSKRQPARLARSRMDIYIGRSSPFEAQLARAQSLLSAGLVGVPSITFNNDDVSHAGCGRRETSITLHGLGAAINRCINLALQLEHQAKGSLKVSGRTQLFPSRLLD
jgi:hypothetical protein